MITAEKVGRKKTLEGIVTNEDRAREWLIAENNSNRLHPSQDLCVASLAAPETPASGLSAKVVTPRMIANVFNSVGAENRCGRSYEACVIFADHLNALLGVSQPDVVEMNVCEIAHLILHPGQLYRFRVAEGCQGCKDYFGAAPPKEGV